MSARVGFEDAERVLAAMVLDVPKEHGSLSVDLPQADRYRKEECCEKDSFAVVSSKPCVHADTYADSPGDCYQCRLDVPVAELSRRRIDRRRRAAQRLLYKRSPLTVAERLDVVRAKRSEWASMTPDELNEATVGPDRDKSLAKVWRRGRGYPVTMCCIVPLADGLSLEQHVGGKVDRNGVFRCGSVWTCPSCCQRISVPRQQQIQAVQDAARAEGFVTAMFTFTMPHDKVTSLETGLNRIKDALRRFHADGTGRERKRELGYLGHVVSTEVTVALDEELHDNGWHAHAHGMFVFKVEGELALQQDKVWALDVRIALFDVWKRAAVAAGSPRPPSFERGFDVRIAWSSTDYIVKLPEQARKKEEAGKKHWGIGAELTKSYMKEKRKKSRTPFELLDCDQLRDQELFREYAAATYGRSQLEWSRGKNDLRKRFLGDDYSDLTDEEAAAAEPEYELADERPALEADPIIERADVSRGDCWRAVKYGRNALDRAIANVDGGGAISLEVALREKGFTIHHVSTAWTEEVDCFHEADKPELGITAGDKVVELVRDRPNTDWRDSVVVHGDELLEFFANGPIDGWEYRMRQAKRFVSHPKRYEVRFPERVTPARTVAAVATPDMITEADCPF